MSVAYFSWWSFMTSSHALALLGLKEYDRALTSLSYADMTSIDEYPSQQLSLVSHRDNDVQN